MDFMPTEPFTCMWKEVNKCLVSQLLPLKLLLSKTHTHLGQQPRLVLCFAGLSAGDVQLPAGGLIPEQLVHREVVYGYIKAIHASRQGLSQSNRLVLQPLCGSHVGNPSTGHPTAQLPHPACRS